MQKVSLYKSGVIRFLAIALCILWAVLIFSMSNEVATDSAERSDGVTRTIVSLLFKDFDKLGFEEQEAIVQSAEHVVRKVAHFCIFGVLGALLTFASLGFEAFFKMHFAKSVSVGFLYAVSDEIHQYFVPGRGPGVIDVLIDTAGVICGATALIFIVKLIVRRKK